jgi:hypothetical protein
MYIYIYIYIYKCIYMYNVYVFSTGAGDVAEIGVAVTTVTVSLVSSFSPVLSILFRFSLLSFAPFPYSLASLLFVIYCLPVYYIRACFPFLFASSLLSVQYDFSLSILPCLLVCSFFASLRGKTQLSTHPKIN